MNIGSAVRSQEFDADHIEVASTWPGGVDAVVRMATKPQMPSASAIQTPEPSTANKQQHQRSERRDRSSPTTGSIALETVPCPSG